MNQPDVTEKLHVECTWRVVRAVLSAGGAAEPTLVLGVLVDLALDADPRALDEVRRSLNRWLVRADYAWWVDPGLALVVRRWPAAL